MTQLTRAQSGDLERLLPLVVAFHTEMRIEQDDSTRREALLPLLDGSPYGAVFLAGPARAPVGYCIVTYGWSTEFGGQDGFIDEIFVRPPVRGRGLGRDILNGVIGLLTDQGVRALHLEVDKTDDTARALYERLHFRARDRYMLMSRKL
ncbi:MAG: GNAT family N-acetyltransferase [Pseudomonadota bacterium]